MDVKRIYKIYYCMKSRCYNPKNNRYRYYGEKGITVCEDWLKNREKFKEWALSNGYTDKLTIDRIDNDKGYCPENCRWVDIKTQANNKSNNHLVSYKGQVKTIVQWAEEKGLTPHTLYHRLNELGWDIEKAIETAPNADYKLISYKGKVQHLRAWCKELGLDYKNTHKRITYRKWSIERAFTAK